MPKRLRAWGPALAWAAVLFWLSSRQIGPDSWILEINDKIEHLGLYAVLGGTLAHGRRSGGGRLPHALLILIGALYGVTDELHQRFVPGRTPSVWDWLADVAGVLLGYGLAMVVAQRARAGGSTNEATG